MVCLLAVVLTNSISASYFATCWSSRSRQRPPIRLAHVAVTWWPCAGFCHSADSWAHSPWVQQYWSWRPVRVCWRWLGCFGPTWCVLPPRRVPLPERATWSESAPCCDQSSGPPWLSKGWDRAAWPEFGRRRLRIRPCLRW